MANDRTLVANVTVLNDVRTSGMPDHLYTHPTTPLLLKGQVVTLTRAQVDYLGTKVSVGGAALTTENFRDAANKANRPYERQASPLPHLYVPGSSNSTPPDTNFIQARLDATRVTITQEQAANPLGGTNDHPELYERVPEVRQVENGQKALITKDVVDPPNVP